MEQLFVLTHRYTILRETEETGPILSRPAFRCFVFTKLERRAFFFLATRHFDVRCVCNPAV